jgi:formamidopyrimidine-DNA glycosylase
MLRAQRYDCYVPELPEVETIRRDLEGRIVGRRISGVRIPLDTGKLVPVLKGIDEASFREGVVGASIESVERRGKYLLLRLDTGSFIVVHLRMTGALLHRAADAEPDRFLRAVLLLDDGSELRFTDIRKFGGLWLVDDVSEAVATGLGPEPLSESFTVAVLSEALKGRKTPVKSVLLDQSRIAGIGNIYADEALFFAKIRPTRPSRRLTRAECDTLVRAARRVLERAIVRGGSSIDDFVRPDGSDGEYQRERKVYAREGEPCPRCGSRIERVVIGQRSTHFCRGCQR